MASSRQRLTDRCRHLQRARLPVGVEFRGDVDCPFVRVRYPEYRMDIRGKGDLHFHLRQTGGLVIDVTAIVSSPFRIGSADPAAIENHDPHSGALTALESDAEHAIAHSCAPYLQSVQFNLSKICWKKTQQARVCSDRARDRA